eukprot:UN01030
MSWENYVTATTQLGFSKVTLIARANYQVIAKTSPADIPIAWKDGDKQINENQELLDNWTDVKKGVFCFYGKKFNIILREPDDDENCAIVCAQGNEICLARQFKSIWFVAYGIKKKQSMRKEDKKDKGKKQDGFAGAQGAYASIMKNVWDALADGGI